MLFSLGNQIGAITHGKDGIILGGLQCWPDDKLVGPAHLQTVQVRQYVRAFYACRPDHKFGWNEIARGEADTFLRNLGDACTCPDVDAKV